MTPRPPRTILTNTGQYFFFDNPEAHDFTVHEIAHSLAHLCRYTGHVKQFYSVAQHSVMVSYVVPPAFALEGLMHDAAEAYLGDVASPLKALLTEYKLIEARVERAITAQFGLPFPLSPEVKQADIVLLMTEKRDLLTRDRDPFGEDHWGNRDVACLPAVIKPWEPEWARKAFINRYLQLTDPEV